MLEQIDLISELSKIIGVIVCSAILTKNSYVTKILRNSADSLEEAMNNSLVSNFFSFLRLRKPYYKRKYGVSRKIPKKIHQLWIPPSHLTAVPDDVLPQIYAWKKFHPDFEHRLWTINEVALALPASRASRMMEAVKVARFEAMKADIVRLHLLAEFGGFWSDLKVLPRRRWLNEYLDDDLVLVEHFKCESVPEPGGILTNNIIGARPREAFIEACIERAHLNIDTRLSASIYDIAGPKMLMDVYSKFRESEGVHFSHSVLSSDYVWNDIAQIGSGSYSANHNHWSIREKQESTYVGEAS